MSIQRGNLIHFPLSDTFGYMSLTLSNTHAFFRCSHFYAFSVPALKSLRVHLKNAMWKEAWMQLSDLYLEDNLAFNEE